MAQRIAVLGAGANGASIGVDLTAAGLDVTLIEQWPAHVEAMRERGARIETPAGTQVQDVRVLHLCQVAELTEPFDVVLMLMKAYDARWAAQLIEPVLRPDGLLVGGQNGMTADVIAEVVGARRTVGCVIEVSSMMYEPGVVLRNSGRDRSWFAVGALSAEAAGREAEVAALLGHSGTVAVVDDIRSTKWMKLVSNCTTLVTTAIVGLPMVGAAALPGMRDLMIAAGQEALDAGRADGHRVLPLFGLHARDLDDEGRVVEVLLDTLYAGFVLPETKTTILQDWERGRRSEVGELNGEAVRVARRHGLAAPVNAAVVEVARRIERRELRPDPGNVELLRELAGRR